MPSPFPGMDPYLEASDLWQEFHSRLIVAIADDLGPQLRPKYRVAIEKRVYTPEDLVIGRPDVIAFQTQSDPPQQTKIAIATKSPVTVEVPLPEAIQERYLEVREVATGQVVTVVELLSPSNKRAGQGRQQYLAKRLKILGSQTHLVELDLLRAHPPMPLSSSATPSHYRLLISRAEQRPKAMLYPFNLPEPIPAFPFPLTDSDAEPVLDLGQLLNQVYDRASYDLAMDYAQPPSPPLTEADVAWIREILRLHNS
ncbi:MAG: DUF4058 family protein [Cyanobacteria bacterium P01_D01_bin.14]